MKSLYWLGQQHPVNRRVSVSLWNEDKSSAWNSGNFVGALVSPPFPTAMVKEEQQQLNEDKTAGLRSSMLSAFSWFQTKCSSIKLKRKREGKQDIYSPGSLLKGQLRLALSVIKDHCFTYNNFLYKTSFFQVLVTSSFLFPFQHKIVKCSTIPSTLPCGSPTPCSGFCKLSLLYLLIIFIWMCHHFLERTWLIQSQCSFHTQHSLTLYDSLCTTIK